jgi:outer membrane protein OmpA-like peptidoglycan-associated protein
MPRALTGVGVTLTSDSVYGLPGESFDELADVDATNRVVTTPEGKPVTIYLLGSDTLFDVGSSTVKSTAEAALPDVIASIEKRAPNGKILVRGFTDSSGSVSGNQALSEARAAAMVAWLGAHGLAPGRMEAAGYGSTRPAAEETGELGPALNRRIEIVVIG